jgi:hypothetical protein
MPPHRRRNFALHWHKADGSKLQFLFGWSTSWEMPGRSRMQCMENFYIRESKANYKW